MKIWQILMLIWMVMMAFMLMNHFHRENLERERRRKSD